MGAYLQTTTELRAELDALNKRGFGGGISSEDRGKLLALERSVGEVRNLVNAKTSNSRGDSRGSDALITKDIQELHARVSGESAARLDLSQSLDAYRNAYLQTTTELRAELDMALEKLARLESRRNIQSNSRLEQVPVEATVDVARASKPNDYLRVAR